MIFKKLCERGHVTDTFPGRYELDAFDAYGYLTCYARVKVDDEQSTSCLSKAQLYSPFPTPWRYYSPRRDTLVPIEYTPSDYVDPYKTKELPPLPRMYR